MQARDVMTRSVVTVRARDSVHRSAELMSTHNVTSVPVLDEDDRVVGIVSEADLIRHRMPTAQERVVNGLARKVPGVLRVHTHNHWWN